MAFWEIVLLNYSPIVNVTILLKQHGKILLLGDELFSFVVWPNIFSEQPDK